MSQVYFAEFLLSVARMILDLVSRWFAPVSPPQEYRQIDYSVLWIVLTIGAFIRFWGLDNVGLHGDEETMAMPAMAILEKGEPILPSGMYYARALIQIYLMSGSVWIFGESEWALRLPSAIVGSLTGLVAFFMGRRFLAPHFNLAFVATIVFLPSMIEASQTARMYVFFVTCAIWFGACLFRWERDQQITSLLMALAVWMLCLHFQKLAIFAAPLFLFPGLSRRSWRQLIQGTVAFAIGALSFFAYDSWISSKYPSREERPAGPAVEISRSVLDVVQSSSGWVLSLTLLAVLVLAVFLFVRLAVGSRWTLVIPITLIAFGLILMAFLQYHVGVLILMTGAIFWVRNEKLPSAWLIAPVLLAITMTALHLGVLYQTGLYPGRKLFGALVGMPSVWPILRFLQYSPIAGAIYGVALILAVRRFAKGGSLPIHFLFFAMAVWIPLLIIGIFTWDIPPRYAQGQLGYFLLCTFAGISFCFTEIGLKRLITKSSLTSVFCLVLASVALINPMRLIGAVNPSYDQYPDHKGAADYIQSLNLSQDSVLIAEDILQQTYYLGNVDYWLRERERAYHYSIIEGGKIVDQYTGAETISSGHELTSVLDNHVENDVYVIGSGENFQNGVRLFRGLGIAEVLASDRLQVVYIGRDGKTKVWKLER